MTSAFTRAQGPTLSAPTKGSARRGACPTLYAPMQTGDGLLARIRIAGAACTPAQLATIAELAIRYGNGLVEVTARGNLQVRGLDEAGAAPFADAVAALLPVETGLVVDTSPLAGLDPEEVADPRPLAEAIAKGSAPLRDRLGPKVSIVIDAGGQISLGALKADIRIVATEPGHWMVSLGGGKPQRTDAQGAIAATLATLGAMAALGPDTRATDLFPPSGRQVSAHPASRRWPEIFTLVNGATRPVALPFGAANSADLIALCQAASDAGVNTIRLAPGHVVLFDEASDSLIALAAKLGFVTRPDDPRRRISACIGNRGCASGHIASREIAARIAELLPAGRSLHVSGCTKGCAHPRPADVTLVGMPHGIGLVIAGRAGDTPERIVDETALAEALVSPKGRQ